MSCDVLHIDTKRKDKKRGAGNSLVHLPSLHNPPQDEKKGRFLRGKGAERRLPDRSTNIRCATAVASKGRGKGKGGYELTRHLPKPKSLTVCGGKRSGCIALRLVPRNQPEKKSQKKRKEEDRPATFPFQFLGAIR